MYRGQRYHGPRDNRKNFSLCPFGASVTHMHHNPQGILKPVSRKRSRSYPVIGIRNFLVTDHKTKLLHRVILKYVSLRSLKPVALASR